MKHTQTLPNRGVPRCVPAFTGFVILGEKEHSMESL